MKTIIKTALFLSLSLCSFSAFPSVTPDQQIISETEKIIRENVKLPSELSNQKVQILFTTNDNGQVNFVMAKTSDAKTREAIEKQFYNLRFSKLQKDVVHSAVINFKTI
jgi:hypothetical protein